jgi:pimeloyl-ACP methyl ester carboxylesterase
MPSLWFLTAPPLGPELFRTTISRLQEGKADSILDPAFPKHGLKERAAAIATRLEPDTLLVAHGLAVPAAILAATLVPPARLVLSNGPITRLDSISAGLARTARLPGGKALLSQLFRPSLWLPYLASSAGLRRAVINPYVMDRDTVATLAGPEIATAAHRKAIASYLASLYSGLPDPRQVRCPISIIWGDADPLYPASEADYLDSVLGGKGYIAIAGGQHFHPEERPWELAEAIQSCIASHSKKAVS